MYIANFFVVLASLKWSIEQTSYQKLDLPWLSDAHGICWDLNWILTSSQMCPILTIYGVIVDKLWRSSSISCKHVSLWCLLFDPHLTTHQSNSKVQLRIHLHSTLLARFATDQPKETCPIRLTRANLRINIFNHIWPIGLQRHVVGGFVCLGQWNRSLFCLSLLIIL